MGEAFGLWQPRRRRGADAAHLDGQRRVRLPRRRPGGDARHGRARRRPTACRSAPTRPTRTSRASAGARWTMDADELTAVHPLPGGRAEGFLDEQDMPLSHLKPHGALYGRAARDEATANAVADAAEILGVPVLGMAGTQHETVYAGRGVGFVAEYYADLDYDDDGSLIITRQHAAYEPDEVARAGRPRARRGRRGRAGRAARSRCAPTASASTPTRPARRSSPAPCARPCATPRRPDHSEEPMARHEIVTPVPGTFYRRPDPTATRSRTRATRSRPGRRSASWRS